MALVSLRNMVQPLTNTVHLVTIALIVLLFAGFRLAGGAFSSQTVGEVNELPGAGYGRSRSVSATASGDSQRRDEQARPAPRLTAPQRQESYSDSGEDAVNSVLNDAAPRKRAEVPANNRQGELDEIERRLGLQ